MCDTIYRTDHYTQHIMQWCKQKCSISCIVSKQTRISCFLKPVQKLAPFVAGDTAQFQVDISLQKVTWKPDISAKGGMRAQRENAFPLVLAWASVAIRSGHHEPVLVSRDGMTTDYGQRTVGCLTLQGEHSIAACFVWTSSLHTGHAHTVNELQYFLEQEIWHWRRIVCLTACLK